MDEEKIVPSVVSKQWDGTQGPSESDHDRTVPPKQDDGNASTGPWRSVQDEEENLEGDGSPVERQQSSTVSIWAYRTMSFPQEMFFVITVCLTQFCNRKSVAWPSHVRERDSDEQ